MAAFDRNARAVLALIPLLLTGCTASPRSELTIGGSLVVVTYVVGDGCRAARGNVGASDGEQTAAVSADVVAREGDGDGRQVGAVESLLASDVGC